MLWAFGALAAGIIILVFSADKFVEGAAVVAKRLGLPPLLIGMLVIGFGSSAPEMVISALASYEGNPNLALGNAFGSNITNIALILGITALISPIAVESSVLQRELPLLAIATVAASGLLYLDSSLSRIDGILLIGLFAIIMGWSIVAGLKGNQDHFADTIEQEFSEPMSMSKAVIFLVGGLVFLVLSSRLLVWGGVEIAQAFGISDLIIGLTIVAVGTSLPELASCIAAVRKNEHDLALGNVIGSNLFNTTIVVGISGTIAPNIVESDLLTRDLPVLAILTAALFIMAYNFRSSRTGRINRLEAAFLLVAYLGYNASLAVTAISS